MWFCPSCGSQNENNARFCEHCGAARPAQSYPGQNPQPAQPVNQAPYAPVPPVQPKKKSRWWLWLLLVLAVLAAAAVICFFTVHLWTPATCTEPETCRICGKTRGAALGHLAGEPTCENAAVCSRCGAVVAPALGHDWSEATCTEPSYCFRCGAQNGSALGHDWQPATYEKPETCARCGETRGDVRGWIGDLYGSMGSETLKLYGNNESHPFILSEPVYNCLHLTLYIKLTDVTGDPYGQWGLYARDLSGSWSRLTTFNVTRSAFNNYVSFSLDLDGTSSFSALTLVPLNDNDYSISYSFYYEDAQSKD